MNIPQKDANALIRAWEALDAAHFALMMVGNEPLYMDLRGHISGLIDVIGRRVSQEQVDAFYEERRKRLANEEEED